ncbi:MAG: hypothetical protein ACR2Q3_10605 [Woeseiaceae bacterium]
MTRSPLFYPLNRGMDADAGGAAELQTDVMRFMAIISLCLVAIFALVQTIPLTTTSVPVSAPSFSENADPEPVDIEPVRPTGSESVSLIRPEPRKLKPREKPPLLQRPVPKPVSEQVTPTAPLETEPTSTLQPAAASEPSVEQEGFTLRFDSDNALTRLVARNVVGLYAIGQDSVQRMNIDGGNISFWTASSPGKIHEMDLSTVPTSVLSAWRRSNATLPEEIKWGVAIPPSMSRQLNQYLENQSGGSLVIGSDGALRLEQ